ncbi:Retrotransposon protein [Abeliophyllum distichum]|uniref:Retrotransposon protein n=1 Tax=Abeliophyllum distichum TaxID=126358 RepID=A0ABD1QVR9_9LAMI
MFILWIIQKKTVVYYFYNPIEMKVIISKHAIFLEKEFILREASGSKVDLEEIQQTINKISQLDKPMAEPAFDKAQIGNGEPLVPDDTSTLHKVEQGHPSFSEIQSPNYQ